MSQYEQYVHHGRQVRVRKDLKGQHRAHCLCHRCSRFTPADRGANCYIANLVYAVCVAQDLVLPVWECPNFWALDDESDN